ncbi:hypothetical protein ACHAWF_003149 [Thalassiosira exigua]
MNLYQFIPPQSAHPPGMIKGIIFGLMMNYFLGWDRATIKDHILFADNKLRHSPLSAATPEPISNKNRLFIHLEYHPNDIPRKKVCELYQLHCEQTFKNKLGVEQTTIAYSNHCVTYKKP